jgi:DNA-binding CsgD family transcriptional regulator
MCDLLVAVPLPSVFVSMNNGVPERFGLSYGSNVTGYARAGLYQLLGAGWLVHETDEAASRPSTVGDCRMAPFRGRESEVAILRGVTDAARDGAGAVVVVKGAAGIGKSRLVSEACDQAASDGLLVARGGADELDQVSPWGVLIGALSSSDPPLMTWEEVDSLRSLGDQRLAVIDRSRAELEEASARRPVVIAIDDLQWADPPTLLALGTLPIQLFSYPIVWLLALRPVAVKPAVDGLLDRLAQNGAVELHLGALERSAAVELARDVAGPDRESGVAELVSLAEGNPFYIIELSKAHAPEPDGHVRTVAAGVPDAVRAAVSQQLRSLSDDARQLLRVASVLGREFSVAEVAAMSGAPASRLLPAVEQTLRTEMFVEIGDGLAFRHDLLRQGVYRSLPGSIRAALHRDAADALRQTGASPVRIAGHLATSAVPGDELSIATIREAVDELAPTSPPAAAELALRVLELTAERDERRAELVLSAVHFLGLAGRPSDAVALAERYLAEARPPAAVEAALHLELRREWALDRFQAHRIELPERLLSDPGVEPAVIATLVALDQVPKMWDGRGEDADRVLQDAMRAVANGEPTAEFETVARLLVINSMLRGRLEEALARAESARSVARTRGSDGGSGSHEVVVAMTLTANGRLRDALGMMTTAQRLGGQTGLASLTFRNGWLRAITLLASGQLDDAHAEAQSVVDAAVGVGYLGRLTVLMAVLVETTLRRGGAAQARSIFEQYDPIAEGQFGHRYWAAALIADARGDSRAVGEPLDRILDQLRVGCFSIANTWHHRLPQLVAIAQRIDRQDAARSFADAACALAEQNPHIDSLGAAAAHACGLLDQDSQRLREAVELAARSESRLIEAAAREDLSRILADASQDADAIEALEGAYDFYVRAGAHHDTARVRAALRSLGVRKRQPTVARPQQGWESLTRSERVVVDLVAHGMTNREAASELFLSPETINTHLRHAFAKLGIRSRVELARIAAARDAAVS